MEKETKTLVHFSPLDPTEKEHRHIFEGPETQQQQQSQERNENEEPLPDTPDAVNNEADAEVKRAEQDAEQQAGDQKSQLDKAKEQLQKNLEQSDEGEKKEGGKPEAAEKKDEKKNETPEQKKQRLERAKKDFNSMKGLIPAAAGSDAQKAQELADAAAAAAGLEGGYTVEKNGNAVTVVLDEASAEVPEERPDGLGQFITKALFYMGIIGAVRERFGGKKERSPGSTSENVSVGTTEKNEKNKQQSPLLERIKKDGFVKMRAENAQKVAENQVALPQLQTELLTAQSDVTRAQSALNSAPPDADRAALESVLSAAKQKAEAVQQRIDQRTKAIGQLKTELQTVNDIENDTVKTRNALNTEFKGLAASLDALTFESDETKIQAQALSNVLKTLQVKLYDNLEWELASGDVNILRSNVAAVLDRNPTDEEMGMTQTGEVKDQAKFKSLLKEMQATLYEKRKGS
jgi:chromosome segregation ATPase